MITHPPKETRQQKKNSGGGQNLKKRGGGVSNIGGLYKIEENPLPTRMVFTNFHIAKY